MSLQYFNCQNFVLLVDRHKLELIYVYQAFEDFITELNTVNNAMTLDYYNRDHCATIDDARVFHRYYFKRLAVCG